jgi:predicted RNase H-like HicB family nuclease
MISGRPGNAAVPKEPMKKAREARRFTVVLERDEDGWYVASVPTLRGCPTQAKTLDQAMRRIREAVELWREVHRKRGEPLHVPEFVGIQQLDVPA